MQTPHEAFTVAALSNEIDDLISSLRIGHSVIGPSAYDTAWIALLSQRFPGRGFERGITWLREHQHEDGSWGSQALHYHDRIISTLMATIAFRTIGDGLVDEDRIRRGDQFIRANYLKCQSEPVYTVGFSMIIPRLLSWGRRLGAELPDAWYVRNEKNERRARHLAQNPHMIRDSRAAFCLEALVPEFVEFTPACAPVILDRGVASQIAASAAYLLFTKDPEPSALDFVIRSFDRGFAPANFIDFVEILFSLDVLMDGGMAPRQGPVECLLRDLARHWSVETGMGHTERSVPDLDDTAIMLRLADAVGVTLPSKHAVLTSYEGDSWFECYPGESDPSLSVNIRCLATLRNHPQEIVWAQKIEQMLEKHHIVQAGPWLDKWHISPYYILNKAVHVLTNRANHILTPRINWIIESQHESGGWGVCMPTQEETAYAILSLLHWDSHVEPVPPATIQAGIEYLERNFHDVDYPGLWIAKSLYAPYLMIRAAVLAALFRHASHQAQTINRVST